MRFTRHRHFVAVAALVAAGTLWPASRAAAVIVVAEDLLVSLDANDPTAGTASWTNMGSLGGSFAENGDAVLGIFGPTDALGVEFFGAQAYQGPAAPAGITGAGTRSIEVWAYNPALNPEETLVSWGRRGGPEGTNLAFNYGSNGTFGAVGHWGAPDMGWNGNPTTGEWHHLVYTYDGAAARVYDNGVLKNTRTFTANTHADFPINIAAQNTNTVTTPPGALDAGNRLSGAIGMVRIHDGVLNAAAIMNNFQEEAAIYGVTPPPPPPPPAGLVGLWRFDDAGALGHDTSSQGNDVAPQGDAAYTSAGRYGGAVDLDGDGDMLDRATFPTEVPTGNESYSVAAWFKARASSLAGDVDPKGIVGWGNYGSVRAVNALRLFQDNGFRHYWWGADLDASDAQVSGLGVDVDDGEWHHITATYDQLTGLRTLYLDGNLLVQDSPGTNNAAAANFAIGRTCIACAGGEFFDGLLDDVAIFDVALNPNQIGAVMSGNYSEFGGPVPEPSTFVLAGFAAAALAVGVRRSRRASR